MLMFRISTTCSVARNVLSKQRQQKQDSLPNPVFSIKPGPRLINCAMRLQDTVEAEQSSAMKLQREITRLKSVEIDNKFLSSENRKIKGELKDLSGSLQLTSAALEKAKAEAERQRRQSEATLSELQSALDAIQQQVLSVVTEEDGGTQVVKLGQEEQEGVTVPVSNGKEPPPRAVVDVQGSGVAPRSTDGRSQNGVGQRSRLPVGQQGSSKAAKK